MEYIKLFLIEFWELLYDMAPWLVLGFLIAGILHVFFPEGKINRLLGKNNVKSVLKAALLGIPLPLCSCGVIPTGVSIHKNGASKGASVSFLISTPQTGVDSIMVTYSLLGLPFAILRPIVALVTGVIGGHLTNKSNGENIETQQEGLQAEASKIKKPLLSIVRYAFIDFMQDIAKWLVIGLIIAAFIALLVPDDFFASYIKSDFLGMLIILAASVPVYVCATSSVPIAAVLLMKGISPGAALVFLMAGPATNAATISVIGNAMGRKTLITYLATIIGGALIFGILTDQFLPREWFMLGMDHSHMDHSHEMLPQWLHYLSSAIIALSLINIFGQQLRRKIRRKKNKQTVMEFKPLQTNEIKVIVKGMTCSHCKANVENNLRKLEGVEAIDADIETDEVTITGSAIDLDAIKQTVESIGYKFEGKTA